MTRDELLALQRPLKEEYRNHPEKALVTLLAQGRLIPEELACRLQNRRHQLPAGLHPAAGGQGQYACSGEMLLESLVACFGVTLCAVATAMEIPLRGGTVSASGLMDFRGTLAVSRDVPVGMTSIKLHLELDTDAPAEQVDKLVQLSERYCVVAQTLLHAPAWEISYDILA